MEIEEINRLAGKPVDIWGIDISVAVAAQLVETLVVRQDEQHVWAWLHIGLEATGEESWKYNEKMQVFHWQDVYKLMTIRSYNIGHLGISHQGLEHCPFLLGELPAQVEVFSGIIGEVVELTLVDFIPVD